jgi:Protein of unknown function (DUF4236)
MGFRFHKRLEVAPGVRLDVSKSGGSVARSGVEARCTRRVRLVAGQRRLEFLAQPCRGER